MSKLIYLEPDEEITDVIDKISKVDERSVSLVVPRGSTLANSVVNLKLLEKRGKKMGKDVALVTNDKIAKNLASQIGLSVFASINDAKAGVADDVPTISPEADVGTPTPDDSSRDVGVVKVHQYDREGTEGSEEPAPTISPAADVGAPTSDASGRSVGEVIEAIKDADGESLDQPTIEDVPTSPAQNDRGLDQNIGEETGNYKLIKKPLTHEPKFNADHKAHDPVFEKMRFAKLRRKRIFIGIAIGAAVLIIIGLCLVLPKAKAVISVTSEPFSTSADINVNKDATAIDQATLTIPGKDISKEEELEKPFAASGSKNIGEKAKGKVTVYNNWDQNPIGLPAGTKFSAAGVEFASTSAVNIPGAQVGLQGGQFVIIASGTADVNVEATAVGEQSNVGPTDFVITSIPKIQQSKIYGKSSAAMTGGTNQIVKIITDKDIASAKDSTEKELKDKIIADIKGEIAGGDKLLDSAIAPSVTEESSSNKAGEQVDNFNYKVKMKIEALAFSESDFNNTLLASANSKLSPDREIVLGGSAGVKYDVAAADVAKGTLSLKGTYDGFTAQKYDVGALKNEIKGRTFKTATVRLTAHSGVLSADISATPSFLRMIPIINRRIDIQFNYGNK